MVYSPARNNWTCEPLHGQMEAMAQDKFIQTVRLDDLELCENAELRQLYTRVFGQNPPGRASRNFLTGNLGWAIQARARKQNPWALRNQLISRPHPDRKRLTDRYRPGTRLVREWHGETYEVTITHQGYRWEGRLYRSLTAIAREITGAGWSGPQFFGIRPIRFEKQSTNSR